MQVRARRPSGRAHRAERLAAVYPVALGDGDRVEVEVERVEPEPVVQRDQAAREKVVTDEGHPSRVGRDDRGATRRRVVGPAVRRARLTVDGPAGGEGARRLRAGDGPGERAAPQTLWREIGRAACRGRGGIAVDAGAVA